MTSVASWLPFVRATAIGWLPLVRHPVPPLRLGNQEPRVDSRIKINISGQRFETWRHTLEKFPDSLLGSDEREYFYDETADEYFFDRDPDLFRYILTYYRTGKVHYPKRACPDEFEQELAFFGLVAADAMGDCCYEEYKDRKKDCQEMNAADGSGFGKDECQPLPKDATLRQKLWHAFEYPHSSTSGMLLYYVTGFFIASSVLTNVLETVPCPVLYGSGTNEDRENLSCGERFETELFCVDTSCVLIFSIEYILRLFSSPDRMKHLTRVMSVIDVVAILPYYISLGLPDNKELSGAFVTLRVFRVFRVFKFSRHSQGLRILGYTLQSCARELGFLLFSLSMAVVIFATVVYYTERNVPNTKFTSIPEAFWYTIVTMTTLGYGDMVPQSVAGKLVGGICSLSGVLVIALPVPVIVSNFSRIYQQNQSSDKRDSHKRARLQQAKRTKEGALKKFLHTKQRINERIAMLDHHHQQQQQHQQPHETKLESNSLRVPGNSQVRSFLPAPEFDSFQLQHHHLLLCLEKVTGTEIYDRRQSRISLPPQYSFTPQKLFLHPKQRHPSCCPCFPLHSSATEDNSDQLRPTTTSRSIPQRRCRSTKLGKESSTSKAKPRRSDLNYEGQTLEESNPLIVLSLDPSEQVDFFPTNGSTMETSFHLSTNSFNIDGIERSQSTCTSVLEVC